MSDISQSKKDRRNECQRIRYAANAAAKREYFRKWRAKNPEKVKASFKNYRAANMPRVLEWNKRWRDENPDKKHASDASWAKANPEKVRANNANRRARKRAAEGQFTAEDIERIFKAQYGKCAMCRAPFSKIKPHKDHIVPLAAGGSNWPSNIQLLCRPCNRSKSAKDPIEFARETGRLL